MRNPIALWAGFVLAHLWLGMLALYAPGQPLGDVTSVYKFWIVDYAFAGHGWVGIDTVWVYPIVAIVPMIAAAAFGPDLYASTWLSLVMVVDAIAFALVVVRGRRLDAPAAGWWWIGFLVLLGPVAVGRIDAITVPVALLGMLVLLTRPALAGALLAVATWIKVWPAALVAAVVLVLRDRVRVLLGAIAVSLVVLIVALALGAGANVFSFVTQQTSRGLQIESVLATPWMWDATLGEGHSRVYYDLSILTFQLQGPGVSVAAIATPLLAVAALALLGLGALALRRGREAGEILPPLVLALTVALILFNKVGSPQFVTWLAVPIVFGMLSHAAGASRSFRAPAALGLAIAGLTQVIYPYLYHEFTVGVPNLLMVMVLTGRNILYVALFAWALVALVDVVRGPRPEYLP